MQDWDEAERVRQRLAHRLHDGPIQELTAAQLFLDGLALRMEAQGSDPALRDALDRGLAALRNATVACRFLMDSLRPGLEGEGELGERILRLVTDATGDDAARVRLSVDVPPGFGRTRMVAALALYRVVEDVLDHVRGARATLRRVELLARDGRAELTIAVEHGAPLSPLAEELEWAARRVKALGGSLELTDGGHTVLVALPAGAAADP